MGTTSREVNCDALRTQQKRKRPKSTTANESSVEDSRTDKSDGAHKDSESSDDGEIHMRTADYPNLDDETEKEVTTGDEEFGESDGTESDGTGSERGSPQSTSKQDP